MLSVLLFKVQDGVYVYVCVTEKKGDIILFQNMPLMDDMNDVLFPPSMGGEGQATVIAKG